MSEARYRELYRATLALRNLATYGKSPEVMILHCWQERFRTVSLKTASAVAHIPVLGDFLIRLEDVKLDGLDMDQTSTGISLGEDGSFVLAISGLAAIVEGHFSWRRTSFPFIKGACQARVTAQVRSGSCRLVSLIPRFAWCMVRRLYVAKSSSRWIVCQPFYLLDSL